jgi:hypothetical protein
MAQLPRILLGYLAASFVASLLVPLAFGFIATYGNPPTQGAPYSPPSSWWGVLVFLGFMLLYLAVFALLAAPVAIPAIVLAEQRDLRAPIYYATAGALAGFIPGLMEMFSLVSARARAGVVESLGLVQLGSMVAFAAFFAVLGVLPAMTYWLISGRRAGMRRRAPTPADDVPFGSRPTP